MTVRISSRLAVLVIAASSALGGCTTIGDALGSAKAPPDEFAVVTKAPLIIPPDFTLQPPKPGAAPANQISPTDAAQAALYSQEPSTVAAGMTGQMSQGEKLLLAYAGAANADSSIRQVIAADNKNLQAANEGFTNDVMFWQKSEAPMDKPLDADAEARRLPPPKTATPAPADPTIQKDPGSNNGN